MTKILMLQVFNMFMTMFLIYYEVNVQQILYELKWIYGPSLDIEPPWDVIIVLFLLI
jgi:hypothetical protein